MSVRCAVTVCGGRADLYPRYTFCSAGVHSSRWALRTASAGAPRDRTVTVSFVPRQLTETVFRAELSLG